MGTTALTEEYQKLTHLEHILQRADTYVGSKNVETFQMYVPIVDEKHLVRMEERLVTYSPAFLKIVDEIIVNAADNCVRDSSTDCIKVSVDGETNEISVFNNGNGIPVKIHEKEKIYIPE